MLQLLDILGHNHPSFCCIKCSAHFSLQLVLVLWLLNLIVSSFLVNSTELVCLSFGSLGREDEDESDIDQRMICSVKFPFIGSMKTICLKMLCLLIAFPLSVANSETMALSRWSLCSDKMTAVVKNKNMVVEVAVVRVTRTTTFLVYNPGGK